MAISDISLVQKLELPKVHTAMPYVGTRSSFDEHVRGLSPSMQHVEENLIEPRPEHLNPCGFDLTVGDLVAESDTLVTSLNETDFLNMRPQFIGDEYVLQHNTNGRHVYYVQSHERFHLTDDLEAIIDARSTTGRVGAMCHQVGQCHSGENIIAVQPFAFDLQITAGRTRLAQVILRYAGTSFIDYRTLCGGFGGIMLTHGEQDVFLSSLHPRGLMLTLATDYVYRAKHCNEPIPMDVVGQLDAEDFFDRIEGNSTFTMDACVFYLAGTQEQITLGDVCGRISRESEVSGTGLWSHFAGFVQPGFQGPITLECYSLGNRIMREREPVGFVVFDRVQGRIQTHYQGDYQHQTVPRLPKMFKDNSS
jgi:deoxycytidine triphosphate deaminase